MFRTRSAAVLVSLALGSSALGAAAIGAAAFGADTGTVQATAAAGECPTESIIRGLVQDRSGHYVDDVDVRASHGGVVEASALTYESDQPDGWQHGFYGLYVCPGEDAAVGYKLRFEKDGYVTRTLQAKVFVEVGEIVWVDPVVLSLEPKPSRTSARLKDNRIATDERAKVVVEVTSKALPTGEVTVKNGRKVLGSAKLRKGNDGTVTVALPKLARGTYPLKAYFVGSELVTASKSREFKLTVEKPKKHRVVREYRPNIR